jgi:hypothetical protein
MCRSNRVGVPLQNMDSGGVSFFGPGEAFDGAGMAQPPHMLQPTNKVGGADERFGASFNDNGEGLEGVLQERSPAPVFARRPYYRWLIVGTVCIGAFMGQLDASRSPGQDHHLSANQELTRHPHSDGWPLAASELSPRSLSETNPP